jgi:UDP-glucose 4-epimerase
VIIFGDGNQTRDFTYIKDVVEANNKLLHTCKADGKGLNIGCGNRININNLVNYLGEIIGYSPQIVHNGHESEVNIEKGLEKIVKWFEFGDM